MKKLLLVFVALSMIFKVSAQTSPCMVDSSQFPKGASFGILPDSLNAVANTSYSQTIQFKFPKDSNILGLQAHVDSATITAIHGFPSSSFKYQCSSNTCTYKGGAYGCVEVTGNPTSADTGTYILEVDFNAVVTAQFVGNQTIPDSGKVKLIIAKGNTSGIFDQAVNNKFEVSQNYPNPFSQSTDISFNSPKVKPVYMVVRNELGQQVFTQQIQAVQGANTFNFERNGLPQGMYFYTIQSGNDIVTRSMVVKN